MAGWTPAIRARVFAAHWNFYNAELFRQPALDLEQADFALLPPNMAGAVMLWKQRGWQPVYSDDTAVVLVKNMKQFPTARRIASHRARPC